MRRSSLLVAPPSGVRRGHKWPILRAVTTSEIPRLGQRRRAGRPALGAACFVAGAGCVIASFAGLAWFTFTGPSIAYGTDHALQAPGGGPILLNPGNGSSHSAAAWAVLIGSVVTALLCRSLRGNAGPIAQAIAVGLAAVGALYVVGRAIITRWAVTDRAVPAGTSEHLHAGLWLAGAGFVLLAASSLTAARPHQQPSPSVTQLSL